MTAAIAPKVSVTAVAVRYPRESAVVAGKDGTTLALALDQGNSGPQRSAVGFLAKVLDPALFRDALATTMAIKDSDLRYKGRLGVHELLINTSAIKRKIMARANVTELMDQAMSEGMTTLRQDGIAKILQGYTDWEQIRAISI